MNIANEAWFQDQRLQDIFDIFRTKGGKDCVRVCGGASRNTLLKLPINDVDLATKIPVEKVIEIFRNTLGFKVQETGLLHGTVSIFRNGLCVESTTLRKDLETDGRRATVEFTNSWIEDAKRRDFSMNTILIDDQGNVHDPLGHGIEDCLKGKVIFVGDPEERIKEDYLRILRYFRHMAYYGKGMPDFASEMACAKYKNYLKELSRERISKEFLKILEIDKGRFIVRDMNNLDIIKEFIPHFKGLDDYHGLVILNERWGIKSDDILRLRSMIPNNLQAIDDLCKAMRLSNITKRRLRNTIISDAKMVLDWNEKTIRKALYIMGKEAYLDQYKLLWATKGDKKPSEHVINYINNYTIPNRPVTGDHLIKMGYETGKKLANKLKEIDDKFIESDFTANYDELIGV